MIELSVIVATYNRADRLRACLQALASQREPAPGADFEVVVVDDGSNDGTQALLAGLALPFALVVIRQANRGQNAAQNRGADAARGRYLLFLDDDIVAGPTLVAEHLRLQRQGEGRVGLGQIRLTLPRDADWFMRHFAEGWRQQYDELNRGERQPGWGDAFSGNLSVERSTFLRVGGFNEALRRGHDIEMAYRLWKAGVEFVYLPDALAEQDERKRIGELARDFRLAGEACVQMARRQPDMAADLLGEFAAVRPRVAVLRNVLLHLRIPPRALGWIGSLLRRSRRDRRWYRLLHDYFYWSGVRNAIRDREEWQRLMKGTPILMYHAFGSGPRGLVTPGRSFARHAGWLRRLGYQVIGLEEFLRLRREHRMPPARSVVITIDDAHSDTLQHAVPVLRRYGYPATVFVVSDRVGATNTWDESGLRGRPLLDWDELKEMAGNGIEIGAHSATHCALPKLPAAELRREVLESKEKLERRLDVPIRSFAYPFGERDAVSERAVVQAGYWGACGAEPGLNTLGTPIYALRRVDVDGALSLVRFLLALWVGDTQIRSS